jgi:hypothetical protein
MFEVLARASKNNLVWKPSLNLAVVIRGERQKEKNTIKNTRLRNTRKLSLLVKVLKLFLRCSILVLVYKQKL